MRKLKIEINSEFWLFTLRLSRVKRGLTNERSSKCKRDTQCRTFYHEIMCIRNPTRIRESIRAEIRTGRWMNFYMRTSSSHQAAARARLMQCRSADCQCEQLAVAVRCVEHVWRSQRNSTRELLVNVLLMSRLRPCNHHQHRVEEFLMNQNWWFIAECSPTPHDESLEILQFLSF